jgi:ribosomal protein L11 methylase PrmA
MIGDHPGVSAVPGSFRDPAGRLFKKNGVFYRTVNPMAAADFDFVRGTQFYQRAVGEGTVIEARTVDKDVLGKEAANACYVLEHPELPFVSYPYEWSFPALKSAALLHLDLHLRALEEGITLSDASAYNVQFIGARPIFIDILSFRPYRSGEFWVGHRQFCEQFLNPLLLRVVAGIPHNAWYRGMQEGISAGELRRLLPFWRMLSPNLFTHVVLQDFLQRTTAARANVNFTFLQQAQLPLPRFKRILRRLRDWIATLKTVSRGATVWQGYDVANSYGPQEAERKRGFIKEFVEKVRPRQVWDIGCNRGDYAVVALKNGARYVVGFDFDQGALELAFTRASKEQLNFLPLFLDTANPSPSQGWAQQERYGLKERANADALLALAVLHHLVIGRNVPLPEVVCWLVGLAPQGVIEFVPKEDPKVQELLQLRQDIFLDYTEENFLTAVRSLARIERTSARSAMGRLLVQYSREPGSVP